MAENVILIFVGCDKTGKSTLIQQILKKTNRHICIDRFTACQYVYGNYHNKKDTPDLDVLRNLEKYLSCMPIPVIFIHVTADNKIIEERFKIHNEKDIDIDHIQKIKNEYKSYLVHTPMKVYNVNTSEKTINECVEEILEYVDKLL